MNQWKSGEWADVPSAQPAVQPVNTKLSVVLPFIHSEVSDVEKLLQHSFELSGQIARTLFLLPHKMVQFGDIKRLAGLGSFVNVTTINDGEGISSDWQGRDNMRSAAGPNSLFRQAAWFFYLHREYGSWLWLEPDCWPQTARWFYDLEREHFEVGKPFTGVKMQISPDKFYMNGVGIYPWNAVQYAPTLVQPTMWKQHPEFEVGFDVAGGDAVLKNAHITKLIQLTNHLSKEKVELRPETVITHGRINLAGVPEGAETSVSGKLEVRNLNAKADDVTENEEPAPANTFLGAYGAVRDVRTEVSDESRSHPRPDCLSSHETRTQEPTMTEPKFEDGASFSDQIRFHINRLSELQAGQIYRRNRIVSELRKAKLIPKGRKR